MKKLLLLLILTFFVETAYAASPSVKNLDYSDYIPLNCIGDCGIEANIINLEQEYENFIPDFKSAVRCEHGQQYEYKRSGLWYAYNEKDAIEKLEEIVCEIVEAKDGCTIDDEDMIDGVTKTKSYLAKELITNGVGIYETVEINSEKYYVFKDFVKDLKYANNLSNDDRIVYTKSNEENVEKLSVVYFQKSEIDFYKEQEISDVDRFHKISIDLLYDRKNKEFPNDSSIISDTFLVCSECRKCDEDGCDKNVASNGVTYGAQGDLYLSKYCEDHTCAFVWDVENLTSTKNANTYNIEGLKCIEKHANDSDYCEKHGCELSHCDNPIIGVNLNNVLADKQIYSGDSIEGYSTFCEEHFCSYQECKGRRISDSKSVYSATDNVTGESYMVDTEYCDKHKDVCGVSEECGKRVSQDAYSKAGHKMICMDCLKVYYQVDENGNFITDENGDLILKPEKQNELLKKCDICGTQVTKTYKVNGKDVCYGCQFSPKTTENNDGENGNSNEGQTGNLTCPECGDTVDKLYNDSGKGDACIDCDTARVNKILESGSKAEKEEVIGNLMDKVGDDPKALDKLLKDLGVEKTDEIVETIKKEFSEKGKCSECGSLLSAKDDGTRYCPKCKKDENGNEIKEVEAKEDTSTNTSNGSYNASSWGSTAGSWGSTSLVGTTTGASTDPATCVHTNYPVPISVSFTNVTSTTHLQMWNCSNCQTPLTQTYPHTYIYGKCVCGYVENSITTETEEVVEDNETPEIIKIVPDTNELHGGESITVTVADNKELAEIEYLCMWETKKTVTKSISGTKAEINVGTLPTENGEYYLYISSVKDTAGNELKQSEPYVFIVGSNVNEPVVGNGLIPVNWTGSEWKDATVTTWDYNYNTVATISNNTVAGNGDGKWANARTKDGSMYVWIPRYTYKITRGENKSGASWNSLDKPGSNKIEIKFSDGIKDDTSDGYISHPAFTFGTDELTGIWVAKYEASRSDATEELEGKSSTVTFKPGVISWRNLTIKDMFEYSYDLNKELNSHLMKNSEWGAVAYLTSAIGRVPYINNSSKYITGSCGKSQNAISAIEANAWNTVNGVKASTTHNIYGIYDLSGGASEYVAAFVDNGNSNLETYASSLVNADDKYKDVYPVDSIESENNNYAIWSEITGDAVVETSESSIGANSWDLDYSYTPSSMSNIFSRGGYYSDESGAGIFSFNSYDGDSYSNYGFRAVLIVK